MSSRSTAVDAGTLAVLEQATVDGNAVRLTGQLDRKAYASVNKVLEELGGKWNRKAGAHLFPGDAAEALATVLEGGRIVTAQDEGWFATPPAVVAEILAAASLEPWMEVLEPSAGEGAIARPVAEAGCRVDCAEQNAKRAAVLTATGTYRSVECGDFLAMPQRPAYDRVLMNPPFAGKADVAHVRHAAGFVRPGGLLVAIMSTGVEFRNDRVTSDFRDLVDEAGGAITPLPEDAFKASGTGVHTVLVTLPAATALGQVRT